MEKEVQYIAHVLLLFVVAVCTVRAPAGTQMRVKHSSDLLALALRYLTAKVGSKLPDGKFGCSNWCCMQSERLLALLGAEYE
jgi:hypothetical protein